MTRQSKVLAFLGLVVVLSMLLAPLIPDSIISRPTLTPILPFDLTPLATDTPTPEPSSTPEPTSASPASPTPGQAPPPATP